jgi:sugar lactone lactonase YvrE
MSNKKTSPITIVIIAIIAILTAYLLLWPVPIDPAAYSPPEAPELTGVYEPNDYLSNVESLGTGLSSEPEDIAIDTINNINYIFASMANGTIVKISPNGKDHEIFAETSSIPLGLKFDPHGNLIVACGESGLISINPIGEISTLTTEEGGVPFKFTNDLDISNNGIIYFTDSSYKFGVHESYDEIMEHRPNGRFLAYDPNTKKTTLLIDGLHFANGVAISPDQSFLLVSDMGKYRILRYWLTGEKAGTHETFIDNLPGFPDGISSNGKGIFWVAIVIPRDRTADTILFQRPFLRKVVSRLPQFMLPSAKNYGFILGLDQNGNVIYNLQDPTGSFSQITNVVQHNGYLYLGSLVESAVGKIAVPEKP